ncbi:nitroreductase family protein [uncultured Mailhella sp.]|uniref:nitroreductase family protein n=1 Tax=uncultured Mailhella sp. TaxID=1981031 RepID=UPI0025E130FF|nr:nitroreductase family protein [uncultured Mailhella sp.]
MGIEILHDRCLSCECCVSACRRYIFRMGGKGKIEIDQNLLPLCMHCGHCTAVCPGEAIVLDGVPSASLPELPANLGLSPDALMLFLKSKRSVGAYSSREVPREVLEKALDAANYAPSARGAHPVRWVVITEPANRERLLQEMLPYYEHAEDVTSRSHYENYLKGVDSLLRYAPCIVLACAPEHVYGEADCVSAATYLSLALYAQGVASCWAGSILALTRQGSLKSVAVPEGCEAYAALMVGYPDENFLKLPHRPDPVVTFM